MKSLPAFPMHDLVQNGRIYAALEPENRSEGIILDSSADTPKSATADLRVAPIFTSSCAARFSRQRVNGVT